MSECHERLGQFFDALTACPAEQPDRLARLAGMCQPAIDALVERQEFIEAARQAQGLVKNLERAAEDTADVTARRAEASSLRAAVLATGRQHFSHLAQQTAPAGQPAAYDYWSRFEEEAVELARAAQRAEDSGDRYRAHRLFRQAGLFGEAVRVLLVDTTPEGLSSRAEASADGGDPAGAARLYEQAGQPEKAARLFEQAGEFTAAARCCAGTSAMRPSNRLGWPLACSGPAPWRTSSTCASRPSSARAGALRPSISCAGCSRPRLARCRRTWPLLPEPPSTILAPRDGAPSRSVSRPGSPEPVPKWTSSRYAGIWGLDLGTTTCSAALYDTRARQPVLCPWKGRDQFASTLSLDEQGNELIGLAGEETFGHDLTGHISASSERWGLRRSIASAIRSYRPEEVAARLIGHARSLVEGFLAARVLERVGELAAAELGEVHDDWLHWAGQHHDLRLPRPRVVVTIPAYFLNNQKHATRDACRIAGVEVVRLLHEPTAACMAVGRERRLTGRVVVVDLGAGTLDVSFLEVSEGIYDVRQVLGNNQYGGKDFDSVISGALAARLQKHQGIDVPDKGLPRRRLEVAAEYLKIELSTQQHSDFLLRLVRGRQGRAAGTEPRRAGNHPRRATEHSAPDLCRVQDFAEGPAAIPGAGWRPDAVAPGLPRGGRGLRHGARTGVNDPPPAAACGGASRPPCSMASWRRFSSLDVTPLPLGIRAFDQQDREHFSMLIDRNTTIPVSRLRGSIPLTTTTNRPWTSRSSRDDSTIRRRSDTSSFKAFGRRRRGSHRSR